MKEHIKASKIQRPQKEMKLKKRALDKYNKTQRTITKQLHHQPNRNIEPNKKPNINRVSLSPSLKGPNNMLSAQTTQSRANSYLPQNFPSFACRVHLGALCHNPWCD